MDIFGSIGLGAITGLVGPIVTGITNYKMLKEKNKHDVAILDAESKAMIAETNALIQRDKIKTEGEIEVADAEAFTTSIKEAGKSLFQESYMHKLMEGNKFARVLGAVICLLFGFIDFLKGLARPAITYYLIGMSTWITILAYDILMKANEGIVDAEWAGTLFEQVTLTIVYLTVSCVGWWFGDRQALRMWKRIQKKDGNEN